MARDTAAEQLNNYKKKLQQRYSQSDDTKIHKIFGQSMEKGQPSPILTGGGAPIANKNAILTAGKNGPLVVQDHVFLDELSHFTRERVPERVVHAKGAGAFGYFEVNHNITKYCKAKIFSGVGKRTPLAVRFSTVGGESGSADTVRDPRGFAVKFYTEEGIWDMVGNNTPIFFISDAMMFPSFIHTQKRNPSTHLKDADMFWDFITLRPETTHQTLFLFSDRGIPDGYRHMNGYGSHTFKFVNDRDEMVYVKYHFKTDQGIRNLDAAKAAELSGSDPDYGIRDLYNAIANGYNPSWSFYIQVMTPKQAENFRWNPFDLTKVWPQGEFPLIPVGKMVLDRNPENYFSEVEQIGFDPAHMVPGIEPSPDKMLQGRLFAYGDTHRHRIGPNHLQLPVNCPYKAISVSNYQRDGFMNFHNQGGAPNYFPNSFSGPQELPSARTPTFSVSGDVDRYNFDDHDNFTQAATFWRNVLTEEEKQRLVDNLVDHVQHASNFIIERAVKTFSQTDANLGKRLIVGLNKVGKLRGFSANL